MGWYNGAVSLINGRFGISSWSSPFGETRFKGNLGLCARDELLLPVSVRSAFNIALGPGSPSAWIFQVSIIQRTRKREKAASMIQY